MPLEILNRALVFLRCRLAVERAEISSFPRTRIFLARIQPILAGFQFPDHNDSVGALHIRTFCACRATKYSQRTRNPRASNCKATAPVAESRQAGEAPALQRLSQPIRKNEREQRHKDCEIGSEVSWETPILAGMTETAAGDVESSNLSSNDSEREDHDRRA